MTEPNGKDLRRRYGIGLEEYRVLLEAQGGVCAICGKPPRSGTLRVDHSHDDLSIRGLLCNPCNRAATERVARYLADPPGRRFGWTVPVELEAKTIRRREANKVRAKERRVEEAAAAERERQHEEELRRQMSPVRRLREMTRPDPTPADDFHERTARALAETAQAPPRPVYGWSEPPEPPPAPEPPKRRSRLLFRRVG